MPVMRRGLHIIEPQRGVLESDIHVMSREAQNMPVLT